MKKCVTHKKCYPTQEIAEDALIEARSTFEYAQGNGPVAVYRCDDCGYYHLTSRGPVNERLSRAQTDGRIEKQKEVNRWMEKLKRK